MNETHTTPKLSWGVLTPSALLIVIYTMLSYLAFFDQDSFYESMDIPTPEHEFLLWSWGGKNTAVLVGLVLAVVSRLRFAMLGVIAMLVTMQFGDVNAGAQSGTNVFVTWIAFALTMVQLSLIAWDHRRRGAAAAPVDPDGQLVV